MKFDLNPEVDKYLKDQINKQYINPKQGYLNKPLNAEIYEKEIQSMSLLRYNMISKLVEKVSIDNIINLYEKKLVTPREIVIFYIKRIIDQKKLNAIISINPFALEVANSLKESNINKMPLYGVPIVLKDNIATKDDMPNTAGSILLKNSYVSRDSFLTVKLREAGAIIIGKANMSEWANFMTFDSSNGYSSLGGQTKNPYGNFDVGGSSSGSAVAVAANLSPISIGTETSGSLIYPASQNNIFALKPTVGLVSRDLIIPISENQDTAGPMAKNIKDLAKVLNVICAYDERDKKANKYYVKDYTKFINKPIKNLKIGFLEDEFIKNEYREEDQLLLDNIKKLFLNEDIVIEKIGFSEENYNINLMDLMLYEFKIGINDYLKKEEVKSDLSLDKIIKKYTENKKKFAPYGLDILEKSQNNNISKNLYENIKKENTKLSTKVLEDALNKVDAIVTISNYASRVYSCALFPAISIPMGFRNNGEPIGATVISRKFSEDILIKIASFIEKTI
ncbi:amidase family protein [Helicovermis profundi]|uniref:Amidase family protein n=1 Tax=Helicovermis profundi TaxID=3065157 RepID=A0AAU9EQZ9_9FIRM|nr:amidase family protein [Clostridia bacterium S502]